MADIINLRLARKARDRDADQAKSEANRAKHGRTRSEKLMAQADNARAARVLEGARREPADGPRNGDQTSDGND